MQPNSQNQQFIFEAEKTIDINKLSLLLIRKWYLIVGFMATGLLVSFIILRYSKSVYSAELLIKFDDDKGGQVSDLFRYGRISGRIENQLKTEGEIIKSRTVAKNTLAILNYQISFYQKGQIVTTEIYPFKYFNVEPIYIDTNDFGTTYNISFKPNGHFTINGKLEFKLGDTLVLGSSMFKITTPSLNYLKPILNGEIFFKINNPYTEAARIARSIAVEPAKGTSLIELKYTSDNPIKAANFANATAKSYIQESIKVRSATAEQTVKFIDGLIEDLAIQVESAQQNLTDFQTNNKGVELSNIGRVEFEKLTEFETQRSLLELKQKMLLRLAKQLADLNNKKPLELVLLDPEDAENLPEMLELLNGLIIERISLSGKTRTNSPVMVENEQKIKEVKSALEKALKSAQEKLAEKIQFIKTQTMLVTNKLSAIPQKQKVLLNLERTFKVNEKIYGYLMEKKLETRISKSSITANASVVDEATVPTIPVYPIPSKIYLTGLLIGLFAGIGFIFLLRIVYNRIPDKETIETISKTPVIGVIKKLDSHEKDENYELYIMKSPKSVFSESLRGIRTNVNFILKGETHKTICVTSSVSGEGKTFCTVNLAASTTMLGYKVAVVGCDLRRPKIHHSFKGITNQKGLTTYLIGKHSYEEIVQHSEFENLDVIPAGPTPPNPSELIQSEKMNDLIERLKQDYDYVFFDTAPVGLVSDSVSLMAKMDINLFIIRAQYSRRDFAQIPDRLSSDNQITNIYTVLNSFDSGAAVYGSIYKTTYGGYYGGGGYYYHGGYYNKGYGYYNRKYYTQYYSGYYSDDIIPKPWWQKAIDKLKRNKKA